VKAAGVGLLVVALLLLAWLGREGDTRDARAGIGVVLVLAAFVALGVLFRRERHHGSSPSETIAPPEPAPSLGQPPPPGHLEAPPADGATGARAVDSPPIDPPTRRPREVSEPGMRRTGELTPDDVCAAVRRRLSAGDLPALEGDVWRVYDRVCQRSVPLEAVPDLVPGMTSADAQAAWDRLRGWAEDET